MILSIRTDSPEAYIGVHSIDGALIDSLAWQAHRELSDTIFLKIEELLNRTGITYQDLTGVVVFKGPGSFTGLRIGVVVANSLSQALEIPVAAETGEQWAQKGAARLAEKENDYVSVPDYGREARITTPRK